MAQAQRLYARDLPDLQHNKLMTSEGMKGVSDLDRSQRLTGPTCNRAGIRRQGRTASNRDGARGRVRARLSVMLIRLQTGAIGTPGAEPTVRRHGGAQAALGTRRRCTKVFGS